MSRVVHAIKSDGTSWQYTSGAMVQVGADGDLIMWGQNVEGRRPGLFSALHDLPHPVPVAGED